MERHLPQKILQQHTRTCSGERYLYVNIERNQSQEADFTKAISKASNHYQNTLGIEKL